MMRKYQIRFGGGTGEKYPQGQLAPFLPYYSDPEGWPQWTLAQCSIVTQFTVPIAGRKHSAQIALIPWQNAFGDLLTVAARLLSALCDPSLADCSLKWITQDHLNLSDRAVTQARKAVIELQDRAAGYAVMPTRENQIAQ